MSTIYSKCKEALLGASINIPTDTIKVALVDTGVYTFSDTHQFYSSVSSGVVGTPQTLANKSVTSGVFDADDTTFTAVTGATVEALVIYQDTGNPATSRLIAYIDNFTVNGGAGPYTPDSGNATINWDNGTSKIFKLG
jgi:hypothetical protein